MYKETLIIPEELKSYIQRLQIKEISEIDREDLNKPVTSEEIQEAIGSMKLGKAPGPDGFTTKFYKIFQKEVLPKLQIIANNILNGDSFPKT